MPVPAESPPDAGFDVVRRGYDPGQVDGHLRRIDAEIAILATDRNAAVDQAEQLARELDDARDRSEKLRAQVRTLAGPPQSVQGMSERMRSMLRLAQDEVDDMLGRAETEAAQRRHDAEQTVAAAQAEATSFLGPARAEATELAERTVRERAQIASDRITTERRLAADRAAMEQEIAALRAETERQLAAERAAVDQDLATQRATMEGDLSETARRSAQEHALVEEDFRISMDQRRAEALDALRTERADTEREIVESRRAGEAVAREQVAQAEAQARRIVVETERRVAELTTLRGRIAEQLGGARNGLGRVLDAMEPVPGEPGAPEYTNGHPAVDGTPTVQLDPLTDAEPVAASASPRPTPRQRATSGRR